MLNDEAVPRGPEGLSVCGKVLNIWNPEMGQKMQHEVKGHIRQ